MRLVAVGVLVIGLIGLLAAPALALPVNYTCPQLPPHPTPTNVRQLRPNDFSLVMAIGDSMTAAFAADDTDFVNGFIEYRSDSWCIGANPPAVTLFNFFNYFNASTAGGAVANTLPIDVFMLQHGQVLQVDPVQSRLNAAVSMAKLSDLKDQIAYLQNVTGSMYAQQADGWKFLTILIGANDLCTGCPSHMDGSSVAETWLANYDAYLELIYQTFPKTFVAIHYLLNISQVWTAMENSDVLKRDYCLFVRHHLQECPCLDQGNVTDFAGMDELAQAYNSGLMQLASNWQAKNLTDFYVTAIPFLSNMTVYNMTFLSDLDCFHPSGMAHEAFAVSLWNSLFVPYAERLHTIPPNLIPVCPTDDMYLQ